MSDNSTKLLFSNFLSYLFLRLRDRNKRLRKQHRSEKKKPLKSVNNMDLEKYFEVAMKLVEQGGQVVSTAIQQKKNVAEKNSMFDLVTETDKAVEDLLINGLK